MQLQRVASLVGDSFRIVATANIDTRLQGSSHALSTLSKQTGLIETYVGAVPV